MSDGTFTVKSVRLVFKRVEHFQSSVFCIFPFGLGTIGQILSRLPAQSSFHEFYLGEEKEKKERKKEREREREREREGGGGGRKGLSFAGCLTSQQHGSVSQRRICSIEQQCHTEIELHIKLSISPSHSIMTPGQPVHALTQKSKRLAG